MIDLEKADLDLLFEMSQVRQDHEKNKRAVLKDLMTSVVIKGHKLQFMNTVTGDIIDFTDWFTRLIVANGGWTEPTEERASLFLSTGRKEAVKVGGEIHDMYGIEGMRTMYSLIDEYLPLYSARELSAAWHRVGDWLD